MEGDLMESFDADLQEYGRRMAKWKYAWNVIRLFHPMILKRNNFAAVWPNYSLYRNFYTLAYRNLLHRKSSSIIHLTGLSLSIGCALVIGLIIRYELSFDRFHSDPDRLYRIVRTSYSNNSSDVEYRTGVSFPVPGALEHSIPGIENITAILYSRDLQIDVVDESGETKQKFMEKEGGAFLNPNFFKVLDFKHNPVNAIYGNVATALENPYSIVLTRSQAEKYFGDIKLAMGGSLRIERSVIFTVNAVIEDFPDNTDFPFTILFSYSTLREIYGENTFDNWYSVSDVHQAYVRLKPGFTKDEIDAEIEEIHARNVKKDLSDSRYYVLQPLKDMHHDHRFGNFNMRVVSKKNLWALGIVGFLLLFSGSINFINLSTAQSISRSREIGLQKVMGSSRFQAIGSFLIETFILVSISSLLALLLCVLIIIKLPSVIDIQLPALAWDDVQFWSMFFGILFFTYLCSCFYPALTISRFNPVSAIKNNLLSKSKGGIKLRKTLVITQFSILQVLTIATLVVVSQMNYFNNINIGFNKESVINLELPEDNQHQQEDFLNAMQQFPWISGISYSSTLPSGLHRRSWFRDIRRKETDGKENLVYEYYSIDERFFDLYKIKLVTGRNFEKADSTKIIINRQLAHRLGFENPEDAIGQELRDDGRNCTVIGVAENFFSNSLKQLYDNIAFLYNPNQFLYANIKLSLAGKDFVFHDNLKEIKSSYDKVFPASVFSYSFLDENIASYYKEEARFSNLLKIFSAVFIIIGCTGLYGLLAFILNKKSREVAIRKVYGASIQQVLTILSQDFFKQIGIAYLIAVPIAHYFLSKYLQGFVNAIHLSWWHFVIPGILIFITALLSIMGKTMKAANANPAQTLKQEG